MPTIFMSRNKEDLPKRHTDDLYVTEMPLIRAAIGKFACAPVFNVLDIGAGDGRWGSISKKMLQAKRVVGVELRDEPKPVDFSNWYANQDFLTWKTDELFDLIVSNPPFSLAEPIIRHAHNMLAPNGKMVMLLPIGFQSSKKRYNGLWAELPITTIGVLSTRPSFYDNRTSGDEFGLYVWEIDQNRINLGTPREWKTTLVLYKRERCDNENVRNI